MHSVEKKELICENRSTKIEETQKRLLRIIHSSHKEENLERHDTIVNVSPTVYMNNENALHLNYYKSAKHCHFLTPCPLILSFEN